MNLEILNFGQWWAINITLFKSITMFQEVFPDIFHILSKCGKYPRIFLKIMLVLEDIVMDLNNIMNVGDGLLWRQSRHTFQGTLMILTKLP